MSRLKWAGRAAVLAVALPLSGCAAMFGGYDVAPNGLPRPEDELRRELARQPAKAYGSVLDGRRDLPGDDLLRLLYAGTAGRYAGRLGEGAHLLDLASYIAEDRVTTSFSREALSLITSDRALAYVPGTTERLMIPYLAAATYLEAGKLQAAAVEARRIESLLDRLADRAGEGAGAVPSGGIRFLHTFAGAIFEAAGDTGAAEVAYRRAARGQEPRSDPSAGPAGAAAAVHDDSTGEVVVLVESGYVPHRVEQSVMILLPPWQVKMLTEGSAGEKALAAAEAAARILLSAGHRYGDRSGYYQDSGYRQTVHLEPWSQEDCRDYLEEGCDDHAGASPYLLRISWPVLYHEPGAMAPFRVRAGELGVDAVAELDVAAGARRDFEELRAAMVARTVVRAASKVALSAGARNAVEKKDAAAGHLVGLLANLGTLLMERADTRCWHLLPGNVSMVRMRLPPGTHELTLEVDPSHGSGRTVSLGAVEVQTGRTSFVTHRVWR